LPLDLRRVILCNASGSFYIFNLMIGQNTKDAI
jgi:hypothetical protein